MLKIRLQRVGKKNAPSYRVVLAEHTAPPQGKFQEILGFYNPRKKEKSFKKERIEHWLSKGAQLSPTVHNLLISEGVLKGIKLKAWRPKKKKETPKEPEKPVEAEKKEPKEEAEVPTPEAPAGKDEKPEEKSAEASTSKGVEVPTSDAEGRDVGKKPEEKPKEEAPKEKEEVKEEKSKDKESKEEKQTEKPEEEKKEEKKEEKETK